MFSPFIIAETEYKIEIGNNKDWIGLDSRKIISEYLSKNPKMFERLTNPNFTVADQDWGYYDQFYRDKDAMIHLLAKQTKMMVELGQIQSLDKLFHPKYGIGSKNHKDKGTINDVFSVFGHPVRKWILQGSSANTITVYHLFRETVKNELKAFARSQKLDWHKQKIQIKKNQILQFLMRNHPQKTKKLQERLVEINLSLETLILRTLQTNLLS